MLEFHINKAHETKAWQGASVRHTKSCILSYLNYNITSMTCRRCQKMLLIAQVSIAGYPEWALSKERGKGRGATKEQNCHLTRKCKHEVTFIIHTIMNCNVTPTLHAAVMTSTPHAAVVAPAPYTAVVTPTPHAAVITPAPLTALVTHALHTAVITPASHIAVITPVPHTAVVTLAIHTTVITPAPPAAVVTLAPHTAVVSPALHATLQW